MAKKKKAETAPLPEGTESEDWQRYDAFVGVPPLPEGTELPESVAELPEIITVPIPPELWEQIRAEQAQADKARKIIARAIAIRDGLIPPPWMKKTKSKSPSEGWQERLALPIMRALWPPHGVPPKKLSQKAALAQVNEIFEPKYGRELPRPTYSRIVKKLEKLFDAK